MAVRERHRGLQVNHKMVTCHPGASGHWVSNRQDVTGGQSWPAGGRTLSSYWDPVWKCLQTAVRWQRCSRPGRDRAGKGLLWWGYQPDCGWENQDFTSFYSSFYFIFFEHTIEYASRHRLGTLSGFPGSSLCQHFMISPCPSSGHRWHSPFLCISSKSGRSIKGGSVLITILDTKSSFMSPPRQYYLYFNTSEYSH